MLKAAAINCGGLGRLYGAGAAKCCTELNKSTRSVELDVPSNRLKRLRLGLFASP